MKKTVRFNENVQIYWEPIHLSYDLHLSRKSICVQHYADKLRYERLLSPILSPEHREKIKVNTILKSLYVYNLLVIFYKNKYIFNAGQTVLLYLIKKLLI
jgi:hypothetical protein